MGFWPSELGHVDRVTIVKKSLIGSARQIRISAGPQLWTQKNVADLRTIACRVVDLRLRIYFLDPQVYVITQAP